MIEILQPHEVDLDRALGEIDVQIVDPPYSEKVHTKAMSAGTASRGPRARDLGFDHLSEELRRKICKSAATANRWSIVFSDLEGTHAWREAMAKAHVEYVREVPWARWSQPQLSGDRPPSGAEAVLCFHSQCIGSRGGVKPKKKHWNGTGGLTHFSQCALRGDDKHPTEKPLDLVLQLVSYFSDPGETVLDASAGRGTTALACRILGRSCLSLELNPKWVKAARRRVSGALNESDQERLARWIEACAACKEEATTAPGRRRAAAREADKLRGLDFLLAQ